MPIRSRNRPNVSFSMSSLTDIVFLLLIFFIVLSTLVIQNGVKMTLPNAKSKTTEKANVRLQIDVEENVYLNGTMVEENELEDQLVAAMEKQKIKQIALFVDENVPTGKTAQMFALANKHQYGMILVTKPRKGN